MAREREVGTEVTVGCAGMAAAEQEHQAGQNYRIQSWKLRCSIVQGHEHLRHMPSLAVTLQRPNNEKALLRGRGGTGESQRQAESQAQAAHPIRPQGSHRRNLSSGLLRGE